MSARITFAAPNSNSGNNSNTTLAQIFSEDISLHQDNTPSRLVERQHTWEVFSFYGRTIA